MTTTVIWGIMKASAQHPGPWQMKVILSQTHSESKTLLDCELQLWVHKGHHTSWHNCHSRVHVWLQSCYVFSLPCCCINKIQVNLYRGSFSSPHSCSYVMSLKNGNVWTCPVWKVSWGNLIWCYINKFDLTAVILLCIEWERGLIGAGKTLTINTHYVKMSQAGCLWFGLDCLLLVFFWSSACLSVWQPISAPWNKLQLFQNNPLCTLP